MPPADAAPTPHPLAEVFARFGEAGPPPLLVDGHTDVPLRLFERPADLAEALPDGHVDLPRLRRGGAAALVFALYVPPEMGPEAGWDHARHLHALVREQTRVGELELVVGADEVRRTAAAGAVGVLLGLENGRCLRLPGVLDRVAGLGVRYVTLCHNASHEWCDAAMDEPRHRGLSDAGVKIVREMRRRGILVDVSHASDDALLHALDAVRAPIVASHSSARRLCDHPRNLSDSLVRDVAQSGGLVMANSAPFLLDPEAARVQRARAPEWARRTAALAADDHAGREAVRRELAAAHPLPEVTLERYVDHLVHLVEVAGEEHVGVGSDFDGVREVPRGFDDVSRYPHLAAALLARGLTPRAVRMILGESFLRVLAEAERRAD
jgi:membrane dipeptidase